MHCNLYSIYIKTFIIWEDEHNNFDAKKYIENVLNISL